ncbi:hypothetical protein ACHAPS_008287 [Verticillium nonalfalfae]
MAVNENHEAMAHTESVPGTVHLVDTDHNIGSRHANGGDIVLDPVPSSDPSDPLNWSRRRKLLAVVCQNFAYVTSNGQWLAKCILQGFFIAPIEALPEISVTDIVSRLHIPESVYRDKPWE